MENTSAFQYFQLFSSQSDSVKVSSSQYDQKIRGGLSRLLTNHYLADSITAPRPESLVGAENNLL